MAAIEYLTVDHLSTKDLIRIFSKITIHNDVRFNGTLCWIWCGNRTTKHGHKGPGGYGHVRYHGKIFTCHRLMYAWSVGPIPKGSQHGELDHLCRITSCCNPAHLELVTHKINMVRGSNAPAKNAVKTHCIHGHPLSGDNLFYDKGARQCRTCKCKASRKRRLLFPEAVRQSLAKYRKSEKQKIWLEANRLRINARHKERYHARKKI